MLNPNLSIIINGLGTYSPKKNLSNNDLTKIVDTSDEWIKSRTGICNRRVAAKDETTSEMAVKAAKKAIKNANLSKKDIDLLIVGTMTPDMIFPSTACLIQDRLKLNKIPSFDISAACSGFLYILEVASQMIRSGNYKNALIIGTEKLSNILDWQDRSTCVLFGDGAGAAILSSRQTSNSIGILSTELGANGKYSKLIYMPSGGSASPATYETIKKRKHFLQMDGRNVYKHAVKWMAKVSNKILKNHSISPGQLQCIIPHQANLRIIESLSKRLDIPIEKFIINLNQYGNTSSASIPLALNEALEKNRIHEY